MHWKIKITASAKADINSIKKWYKEQSYQALEDFTKELISSIESLQNDTNEHKQVYDNYRRFFLKRFPYTIYYQRKENESIIDINAVCHSHQSTASVIKRLKE